jgi:hypothetical protein
VLLFVIDAQLDRESKLADLARRSLVEKTFHRPIHVTAVIEHLSNGRPREQSSLRLRVAIPGGVVVRIENVRVAPIECFVARKAGAEDKRLEEPARMGEVPLGRADLGHRLNDVIFNLERFAEKLGGETDPMKDVSQRVGLNPAH